MLSIHVRRSLHSCFSIVLLLGIALPCALSAFAQQGPTVTVSPALVTDGGSVTLTVPVSAGYTVSIQIPYLPRGTQLDRKSVV